MNDTQHPLQARSSLAARRGSHHSLRLLFALLVASALLFSATRTTKAGTLINGLEFGLSQCPSYAPQNKGLTDRSLRWATGGYANTAYSSAFEQWTIPTVTPTPDDRYAAVWPGFTDTTQGTIVQAGFATNSVGGKAQYYAWWETFPNPPNVLDTTTYWPVLAGDNVTVTITRLDQTEKNWQITLDDTRWSFPYKVDIAGFYDGGAPQYAYETQPGKYGTTHQFSPHTSPIKIWETGYTVFGSSSNYFNNWSQGDCIRDNQNVVLVYTSTTDSGGGFTITTDPPTPAYPLYDYGPGDNSGCCFSFSSYGGNWFEDFDGGGEEGQSLETNPSGTGQTTVSADWHPHLTAYQWYQVVAYIPYNATGPLGYAHYYIDNQYYAHKQIGLDQSSHKGQWVTLGTFQADGNGYMNVALHNDTSQATYDRLTVDAMSFVPASGPPSNYPLNTYGPGSGCCFSTTGTWYSGAVHGLIGQEIWAWSNGSTGSATANWSPRLIQGATYDIKVYIPNYAANGYVHYYITDDTGTTMVPVNQANYGNVWVDLGDFVANSSTGFITVSLHNDDDAYHTRYVGADAASFTPVRTCITPPCPSTPGTVVVNG